MSWSRFLFRAGVVTLVWVTLNDVDITVNFTYATGVSTECSDIPAGKAQSTATIQLLRSTDRREEESRNAEIRIQLLPMQSAPAWAELYAASCLGGLPVTSELPFDISPPSLLHPRSPRLRTSRGEPETGHQTGNAHVGAHRFA